MVGVALGTALASVGAGALAQLADLAVGVPDHRRLRAGRWPCSAPPAEPAPAAGRRPARRRCGRSWPGRLALLVLLLAFVEGVVLLGMLTLLPPAVEAAGRAPRWPARSPPSSASRCFVSPGWSAGCPGMAAVAADRARRRRSPRRVPGRGALPERRGGRRWRPCCSASPGRRCTRRCRPGRPRSSRPPGQTVVSLFAGSLFAGSALAALLVAGPAEAGRFGAVFAGLRRLTVPLGCSATCWPGPRGRREPGPTVASRDRDLGCPRADADTSRRRSSWPAFTPPPPHAR